MFPQTPGLTLILAGQTHSFLSFLPITQTVEIQITTTTSNNLLTHRSSHKNPLNPPSTLNHAYFQPHNPPPAIPIPIRPSPHFRTRHPCHNLLSNQRLRYRNFRYIVNFLNGNRPSLRRRRRYNFIRQLRVCGSHSRGRKRVSPSYFWTRQFRRRYHFWCSQFRRQDHQCSSRSNQYCRQFWQVRHKWCRRCCFRSKWRCGEFDK